MKKFFISILLMFGLFSVAFASATNQDINTGYTVPVIDFEAGAVLAVDTGGSMIRQTFKDNLDYSAATDSDNVRPSYYACAFVDPVDKSPGHDRLTLGANVVVSTIDKNVWEIGWRNISQF